METSNENGNKQRKWKQATKMEKSNENGKGHRMNKQNEQNE
jgi:hypothetical protein